MKTPRPFVRILALALGLAALPATVAVPALPAGDQGRRAFRPHVLVLAIDTLRADHLHCLGKSDIATPHMDGLAADGVLFTRAHSTAPWTLPSFASIYTGLRPYRHGAIGGDYARLPRETGTMAEYLRGQRYATAAWVTINWLNAQCGMNQGFKHFRFIGSTARDGTAQASAITHQAMNWLDGKKTGRGRRSKYRQPGQPFFAFVHWFDVHAPYTPPAPFDRMYYEGDEKAGGTPVLDLLLSNRNKARPKAQNAGMYDWLSGVTDLDFPVKQYAAGVSYVDDHVGRVLAKLKERGEYDDTLIILVSDHGEHLVDHGMYFTHKEPYQETIHVPLIIKLPRGVAHGRVIETPVSTLDILPTVLETCGLEVPGDLDGRSLLGLMRGEDVGGTSLLVSERGAAPDDFTKTLIEWPWKLMVIKKDGRVENRLYHLEDDPGEIHDVSRRHQQTAERLRERMWTLHDPESPLLAVPGEERPAELDAAEREKLRALGY
ncbi:MAG: sulfatase [bacterium]|nr:sulfatase [bacterium]